MYVFPAECFFAMLCRLHVQLTPCIEMKFIHSQLHRRRPSTMARTCQTPRYVGSNVLYQSICIVDVDGMVRYVPMIPFGQREIDWRCKDIFDYCQFFFVRPAENVSFVQCNCCSKLITRKLGWRLLRNHLVDCVGNDSESNSRNRRSNTTRRRHSMGRV